MIRLFASIKIIKYVDRRNKPGWQPIWCEDEHAVVGALYSPYLPINSTPIITENINFDDKYLAISKNSTTFASEFKIE